MIVQAPEGTSLAATNSRSRSKAEKIIRAQPEVLHVFDIGGFSFTGSAPNRGIMFALLKPWGERKRVRNIRRRACVARRRRLIAAFYKQRPRGADLRGQSAGDQRRRQFRRVPIRTRRSRRTSGLPALDEYGVRDDGRCAQGSALDAVFTQFRINSPQIEVNIDRNKAKSIGVESQRRLPDDGGRPRLAVRQQFHLSQPLVAGRHSSRRAVPQRSSVAAEPLRRPLRAGPVRADSSRRRTPTAYRRTDRHDADQRAGHREADAGRADHHALQPLPQHRDQRKRRARPRLGRSDPSDGTDRGKVLPTGRQLRMVAGCSSTRSRPEARAS